MVACLRRQGHKILALGIGVRIPARQQSNENMQDKNNKYNKTIKVYKNLGRKYIKDINKCVVKELPEFIKLLSKGDRILDVGCAGGRDSKIFIKNGFKVVGIDLVDVFLKEAKKNVPGAKFIKMDLCKLKFPKNYFNAIWANAILLHIEKKDIPKILNNFYKILSFNGKLHIRVKRGQGTEYVKEKLSRDEQRLFTFFFKYEFEHYIKKAGFKIISSRIFFDELKRKNVKWIGIIAEKR